MKKYLQFLVVLILAVTVVGVARNSPAWASPNSSGEARPDTEVTITEDGEYTIGGVCNYFVKYKKPELILRDTAAVDIPAEKSREVTFGYPDNLYLAGCHLVHFKADKIQNEMNSEEGEWEVCFGDRASEKLTIYYYTDEQAAAGQATWLPLPTVKKDTYVCAPAMYTGVYAPGGVYPPGTYDNQGEKETEGYTTIIGSVPVTIPGSTKITSNGTYGAGGICQLTVEYYKPNLSNELHVEEDIEISAQVPFPDNAGLLYLPGCHVYHFRDNRIENQVNVTAREDGKWTICFAAPPTKEVTIYFYYADNESGRITSAWTPLETTTANGSACTELTDYTGVYAPVGK